MIPLLLQAALRSCSIWKLVGGKRQKAVNLVRHRSLNSGDKSSHPCHLKPLEKTSCSAFGFSPHTASLFLHEDISLFTDKVSDLQLILDESITTLHSKLLETKDTEARIELAEEFLLRRYALVEKKIDKVALIGHVMNELKRPDFFDNIQSVAFRYGITSRYLQKLFSQHTGLTPKLYSKVNRFQNSLLLVAKRESSLTAIAYECGYFDQSHFIREFKTFSSRQLFWPHLINSCSELYNFQRIAQH